MAIVGESVDELIARRRATDPLQTEGGVLGFSGHALRVALPGARAGEVVRIDRGTDPLRAEVVGFSEDHAIVLPLGTAEGIGPGDRVVRTGAPLTVACGE